MICDLESGFDYGEKSSEIVALARSIIFESNLEVALNLIVKAGKELTNADMCNIGLVGKKFWHKMHSYPIDNQECSYSVSDGIMGLAAMRKKPCYIPDVNEEKYKDYYVKCREGTRSELAVPIIYNSDCIGVLNIESDKINAFKKTDCNIMRTLADLSARAVIDSRNHEILKVLQEMDKKLVSSKDPNDTLKLIWESASRLMGTADIRIRLLEEDRLVPRVGVTEGQIEASTWKIGQCIVGRAAEINEPILENDVQNNQYFREAQKTVSNPERRHELEQINSEIAVPLVFNHKVIGVLNAHSPVRDIFTKEDLEVLCALADGAAIAIANIEQNRTLDALRQIDRRIASCATSLHLDETLNLIKENSSKLVRTNNVRIRLVKEDRLVPLIGVDKDQIEAATWKIGDSIVGMVAKTKEPIIENDVQANRCYIEGLKTVTDPQRREHLEKINSEIAVPLVFHGRLIGVLNAYSTDKDAFSEEHERLLIAFADQAAIAIENIRFSEVLANHYLILEGINRIGKYVTKVEVKEVLREITSELNGITKADIPLIYLLDNENEFFEIIYGDIRKDWEYMCNPRRDGSGAEAIAINAMVVAHDDEVNPFPKSKGVKTTIALPIVIEGFRCVEKRHLSTDQDKKLGIMYLHFLGKKYEQTADVLKKFRPIADELALIIDPYTVNLNFQDATKISEDLKNITNKIEKEGIINRINEFADPDILLIYLFDQKQNTFRKLCYSSIGRSWKDKSQPRSDGLGMMALKNRCFAVADDRTYPYINPKAKEKGVKTTAAIPLIFGDKELGVMYLHFLGEEKDFTDEEQKAIETLAVTAAIALENANSISKLKSLIQINEKISKNIQFDEVLSNIGAYAKEVIGNGIIHIWLYDSNSDNWVNLPTTSKYFSSENVMALTKPRKNGIGSRVMKEGKPEYIEDTKKEDGLTSSSALQQGIKSIAAFPLRLYEKVIGVIYFHFPTKKIFLDDERSRLSLFAGQLEVALNNANQYQMLKETNEELQRLRGAYNINKELIVSPESFKNIFNKGNEQEIFQRLFWNATTIWGIGMDPGFSGSGVAMIRPYYNDLGGKWVIAKLGDKSAIELEEKNYNDYVKWFIGGIRSTNLMASAYSNGLGGIVYSLIGNPIDPARFFNFGKYYREKTIEDIESAITKLFEDTCGLWYKGMKSHTARSIDEIYECELPTKDRLDGILDKYFRNRIVDDMINFNGLYKSLPNPVSWIFKNIPKDPLDIMFCITHGDLNENNIILDNAGNSWLIDFYRTKESYAMRDFVRLEATIKFELLNKNMPPEIYLELEEMLINDESDQIGRASSDIKKAFMAIKKIRRIARKTLGPNFDINQYYMGLLAQTMKFLVFEKVNNRDIILMSASMICCKLQKTCRFYRGEIKQNHSQIIGNEPLTNIELFKANYFIQHFTKLDSTHEQ